MIILLKLVFKWCYKHQILMPKKLQFKGQKWRLSFIKWTPHKNLLRPILSGREYISFSFEEYPDKFLSPHYHGSIQLKVFWFWFWTLYKGALYLLLFSFLKIWISQLSNFLTLGDVIPPTQIIEKPSLLPKLSPWEILRIMDP